MALRILLVLFIAGICSCTPKHKYIENQGFVYGTIYNIKYDSPEGKDLQQDIEAAFHELGNSLSTFIDTSVISKVNQNSPVEPDNYFLAVFNRGQEISGLTDGAFDMTVAPLVNAWGFWVQTQRVNNTGTY